MNDAIPLLEMRNVRKSFGNTHALKGITIRLNPGRVYGLVGENGAGKSTLVKSMCGAVRPDSGEIIVDGEVVTIESPRHARELGISTVFQELSLIPDLSLAENIQLQSGTKWTGSGRRRADRARSVAKHWNISSASFQGRVGAMSLRDQQLAEILCALNRPHRVLVLDEPTSALLPEDVNWLHQVVKRVIAEGSAVLIITHMLEEIERFCDEVYIQRNGSIVEIMQREQMRRDHVVEQMIGRSLESAFPPMPDAPAELKPVVEARGISTRGLLRDVNLKLNAGEIVGVVGLDGQGQQELFGALSGETRITGGEILLRGKKLSLRSPAQALRPGKGAGGIAMVPAERKTHGTILDLSIRKNVSLPVLRSLARVIGRSDRAEDIRVRALLKAVQVDPGKIDHPVRSLSGGNQQKVVFARALASESDALLLFDPTRGVDVGTKHEIYKLVAEYASNGKAVLMYSTEIPEIVNMCHRVLVCYRGRIVAEKTGDEMDESKLMSAAIGHVR